MRARILSGLAALAAPAVFATPACAPEEPELIFGLDDDAFWRDDGALEARRRVLVTNNYDDTVSVLDLDRAEQGELVVLATVPVGLVPVEREGPHHVAAHPDGTHYYVAISNFVPAAGSGPHGAHGTGTADGHVLKIRSSDDVTVASARVDRSPGDVRVSPDGRLLLVSHFDVLKVNEALRGEAEDFDSTLVVLDAATLETRASVPACPGMHGIAIAADSTRAYVSCMSDELVVVDLEAGAVAARLPVVEDPGDATAPVCFPYATTLSPDGGSVWVSCSSSGEVVRYDVASGEMDPAAVVRLNGPAMFGAFTADGATFVVPYQGDTSAGLAFVDPSVPEVREVKLLFPDICAAPHAVRFVDDERKMLLVCEGDHVGPGTLVVLDAATRDVLDHATLGRYPDDVALLEVP